MTVLALMLSLLTVLPAQTPPPSNLDYRTGTLSGGTASFTTSSLQIGSHSITATYGGDGNFTGSTSAVLTQSVRLKETELVELAKTKGQAHLAVIAGRQGIGEAVTDVLVRRGDAEVMHNVADNQTAKLSEGGFSALVKRAEGDGDLAEKVGQRPDIPAHLFRDLLVRAGLPTEAPPIGAAKALDLMQMDKKVLAGAMRLVLLEKLGRAIVTAQYAREALDATVAAHFK